MRKNLKISKSGIHTENFNSCNWAGANLSQSWVSFSQQKYTPKNTGKNFFFKLAMVLIKGRFTDAFSYNVSHTKKMNLLFQSGNTQVIPWVWSVSTLPAHSGPPGSKQDNTTLYSVRIYPAPSQNVCWSQIDQLWVQNGHRFDRIIFERKIMLNCTFPAQFWPVSLLSISLILPTMKVDSNECSSWGDMGSMKSRQMDKC